MPETGPRGAYAKTADRRREIVRAARDGFVERGVEGASLRDIARRAGITHAGVLHHFRNRDELVVEVLRQRNEDEAAQARAREQEDPGAPVGPFLVGLLRDHRAAPELMRLWGELTASASRPGHAAHGYFVERYASTRVRLADAVRREAAPGAAGETLGAEAAAALLTAVMDGLQTQWLLQPDLPIDELLSSFLELLLRPLPGAAQPSPLPGH